MGTKFEEYLYGGTKKIIEVFSSDEINPEERESIISAFTENLADHIGNPNGLQDYEPLIYDTSICYIDDCISDVLENNNSTYMECNQGIMYCERQRKLFDYYKGRGWTLPAVNYKYPEQCSRILRERKDSIDVANRIIEIDQEIDKMVDLAQESFSVRACDQVFALIDNLETGIAACKEKRISLPLINNANTEILRKRIAELRRIAEQKDLLHDKISDNDSQIYSAILCDVTSESQCKSLISLCMAQKKLLEECRENEWPLPNFRVDNLESIIDQYQYYIGMLETDRRISQDLEKISTQKQFDDFQNQCISQRDNINLCGQYGWKLPLLENLDPISLRNEKNTEFIQKKKHEKFLYKVLWGVIGVACIVFLVLWGIYLSRAGKVTIPFDSSYVVGQDVNIIYEELIDAGFINIFKKPNDSGWQKDNGVISVSIDKSREFSKGSYRKPDVSIVIEYSSNNRIYITEDIKGWENYDYTSIEALLKEKGFLHVITEEVITEDGQKDNYIANIKLNGEDFTSEECYLPKDAPIIISYYSWKYNIGYDSAQLVGLDYQGVINDIKERGFTNIHATPITTGWARGNTVVGITIDNDDMYNSEEFFEPDVEIIVKYSSNDRIDITEPLVNWSAKDYEELVSSITSCGFNKIRVTPTATKKVSQNRCVSDVLIDNEKFDFGECFVPETSSIEIICYVLYIKIGQTAKQFVSDKQYTDVVLELESMGFTNIHLQRANDIKIGLQNLLTKEGSIKSISISGNNNFTETDEFNYNSNITIIVHTKPDSGCTDITEIASP